MRVKIKVNTLSFVTFIPKKPDIRIKQLTAHIQKAFIIISGIIIESLINI